MLEHYDIPNHDRHFDPPDDSPCPGCYPEEGSGGELCASCQAADKADAEEARFEQYREEQAGIY